MNFQTLRKLVTPFNRELQFKLGQKNDILYLISMNYDFLQLKQPQYDLLSRVTDLPDRSSRKVRIRPG